MLWKEDQSPRVRKGRKPSLRGEWDNVFSGMNLHNVQKETHVVPVTNSHLESNAGRERGGEGDDKNNRPLLLLKRRHRLTGKYPPKVQVVEEKGLSSRTRGRKTCNGSLRRKCTNPSCNLWHPSHMSKLQVSIRMHIWR